MKTEEFTRKDGSKGTKLSAEVGDKVTALEPKVREYENLSVVKGKATKIINRVLKVKTEDNQESDLKITDGQAKVLGKVLDLTGKTIVFEEYTNDYGKQIGARVE